MPNASQRYSADTIISNRAELSDGAFLEISKNTEQAGEQQESHFRRPDPDFLYVYPK